MLQGCDQEARSAPKSSSEDGETEKSENVDFVDPSHEKSLLLRPTGGQGGGQMESKINFYSYWKAIGSIVVSKMQSG